MGSSNYVEHRNPHILMLPFMAHGHLIPFLSLAQQIHQRTGFNITIANTPSNIKYLRSTAAVSATATNSKIILRELPFSSTDHGLPPNTENTENLRLDQIAQLFHASTSLKSPVESLVADIATEEGQPPLCLVADVFFGWSVDVARKFGIKSIAFSTGGAYGTLAYISIWENLPHRKTTDEYFNSPGFPDRCRFHLSQLHRFIRNADGTDVWSMFFRPQIAQSLTTDGWLCNAIEEAEVLGIDLLRKYIKLPVWCIGPLLPQEMLLDKSVITSPDLDARLVSKKRAGKKPGVSAEKCIDWLDKQDEDSVLYISFGSQNTITESQMMELAIGLELSREPFIWVIRPPLGFDMKGEFEDEWLPSGFEKRASETNQGLLVRTWAPQLEILCHRSTRAFLSHCGWNSVMESLSQGVSIIAWPMAAEQAYNAKMLVEEMGVCVELTRGIESKICGEQVKSVVDLVMEKKGKGEEMRKKAMEIAEIIRAAVKEEGDVKGSSLRAMDEFIKFILPNESKEW